MSLKCTRALQVILTVGMNLYCLTLPLHKPCRISTPTSPSANANPNPTLPDRRSPQPHDPLQVILTVDMNLYCLALLLEIASLLRLRSIDPHRERPYRIPAEVRVRPPSPDLSCHLP